MKRTATIALALVVVFLGVSLCGCGGDSGKAKSSIQLGDKSMAVLDSEGKTLGNDMENLYNSLYHDITSGKTPDAAGFKDTADDLKSQADRMLRKASSARAEYLKVDSLKDVPEYKKYADLKVRIIDANVAGINQLKTFLNQSLEKLSGTSFDPIAFQSFVTEFADSLAKQGITTGELQSQAKSLKKKYNL
ncbi:MAG TPA: hypothetical protein VIK22_06625 [Candidatus Anoxymicrobiaceae bacterium]